MRFRCYQACLFCQRHDWYRLPICWYCYQALPWLQHSCQQCASPLSTGIYCGQCLSKRPSYDHCIALWEYQPPIKRLIQQFKFQRYLSFGRLFGLLLARKLIRHYRQHQAPEAVIAMPLHRKRLATRGYNQAHLIAKPLANALNLPLIQLASRQRHTRPQAELPHKLRKSNVKNSFQAPRHDYQHIAIVDDVLTTGNTCDALAKALKKSGCNFVSIWSVCRTSKN